MASVAERMRRKKGRKQIEGREREPNGRISRAKPSNADLVALEARARHTGLPVAAVKDQKAATFIGILSIYGPNGGGISQAQYEALDKYAEARQDYLRAIAAPGAGIASEGGSGGPDISDGYVRWCSQARERWEDIRAAIKMEQDHNHVDNIYAALDYCVHQDMRLPHLVGPLRIAANCLARHFNGLTRVRARVNSDI